MAFYLAQDEFVEGAQVMFDNAANSFAVPMRIVYRNSYGEIVNQLVNTFDFTMTGMNIVSECAESTVAKESQTKDIVVAFSESEDSYIDLHIPSPIDTETDTNDCEAYHKLYVQDASGNYVDWKLAMQDYQYDILGTYLYFDNESGDVWMTVYQGDLDTINQAFPANDYGTIFNF
jgi:hypothetical protein